MAARDCWLRARVSRAPREMAAHDCWLRPRMRRAPQEMAAARLLASATRVAARPGRWWLPDCGFGHAGRRAPSSNSSLKRVAPKRLSRRVRSRKGSRPAVSSTVSLSGCWLAAVGLPLPRVVGLPQSACRSPRVVGLPLSACRSRLKFEFPSVCWQNINLF